MDNLQALNDFSRWVAGCSGDEKQEARTFLEKLLKAWGWEDSTEAGVLFEERIPKGGRGGGMGYADALIKGKVLVEMKSRGEHLGDHSSQLQRYWFNLTPKPTYAVLCNFDEFWVYDFNQLVDEPVDAFPTKKIADRRSALAFFSKTEEKVRFGNNQVEVTERQAKAMGSLFYELKEQSKKSDAFSELQAQRFVLQCVLSMFAEDRGMLPKQMFSLSLEDCREKKESTYDVLSGLFNEMNTPGFTPGGRFQGTPYFNGGLFAEIPRIELSPSQLDLLVQSAKEDWKSVRPSIFGNIFEASSDQQRRHSLGQHFTSEPDILKVVRPTIIEPWEKRIEDAKTITELESVRFDIQQFKVLDPACGSGNFLYMSYNALKDLEVSLVKKLRQRRTAKEDKLQPLLAFVNTNQFYGMDTDPFAVELARVTLMIARKVAHDRLGLTEQDLPLDNLDKNIVHADALFGEWPEADAIVGNPPFLGGKHMRMNLGDQYIDRIFERYPDVKDSVDFCSYWFRLAHDKLKEDGHAGLVATNSIRHGKSRRATLDYVRDHGGFIHSAVSSQPWSGEANVHVSIVNWSRQEPKSYRLDDVVVSNINSSLRSSTDVSEAPKLKANKDYCFQGVIPLGKGFNTDSKTVHKWFALNEANSEVLRPFSMGMNLAQNPLGEPDRWIIDFGNMVLEEAEKYPVPFNQVKSLVKPLRDKNRRETRRLNWWRYGENAPKMRKALGRLDKFFAVGEVSKWAVFVTCETNWLCGNKNKAVASNDFYVLGVLTSDTHRQWMHAQKGTLEDRITYTHDTCFETFPFPQVATSEQVEAVRKAMVELNDYRNAWMTEKQKGITDLYNQYFDEPASKLSKLHKALDRAVLKSYGWSAKEDLLRNLLDLNLELAEREAGGGTVVGPWDPSKETPAKS